MSKVYPRPRKKSLKKRLIEKMIKYPLLFWIIIGIAFIIFLLILWNSKGQTYGYL